MVRLVLEDINQNPAARASISTSQPNHQRWLAAPNKVGRMDDDCLHHSRYLGAQSADGWMSLLPAESAQGNSSYPPPPLPSPSHLCFPPFVAGAATDGRYWEGRLESEPVESGEREDVSHRRWN